MSRELWACSRLRRPPCSVQWRYHFNPDIFQSWLTLKHHTMLSAHGPEWKKKKKTGGSCARKAQRAPRRFFVPKDSQQPPKLPCMISGKFWLVRFFQQEALLAQILPWSVQWLGTLKATSTGTREIIASLEMLSERQQTVILQATRVPEWWAAHTRPWGPNDCHSPHLLTEQYKSYVHLG